MKSKLHILAFIFCFSFLGCNDLEEEVYSEFLSSNFYKNEEQLQTQNMGLYNTFQHVVWEWWMYDIVVFPGKYATSGKPADTWWKPSLYGITETVNANRYADVWRIAYNCINRANTIIKYAPTSPLYQTQPELVDQYIAEARWFRAYSYFNLVQLFGDVPLYDTPTETPDPSVLFKGRSPKEEIYNLIIEDLKFASAKLPVKWAKTPPGRATKATATMLLGKVYLTSAGLPLQKTENYAKAIETLQPLADNPTEYNVELLPNWKSVFDKDNEGNKEILFAFSNAYENLYGGVLPFHANPSNSTFAANGGGYNMAWSYAITSLYENTDVRKTDGFIYSYTHRVNGSTITFNPAPPAPAPTLYASRNGISSAKYIDGGATNNVIHEKDNIIYRYVDVFLMLAEAYMENDEPTQALKYLNIARARVKASNVTTTVKTDLRAIVREERVRELYGEYTELYDLRRWGTVEQTYLEHPLRSFRAPNRPWDPKYVLSPIPEIERSTNPNLTQNTGW